MHGLQLHEGPITHQQVHSRNHTHTQLTKAKTNFTEPEATPANLGKGWGTCLPGTPTAPWHGVAQGQIDTHMVTALHVFGQLGKLVYRALARKTS